MKALITTTPGPADTLAMGELPDPVAGAGQLLIAVKACSINFPDTLIIEDKYQFRPERPFAPGGEVAGIVEAVGEGVSGFAPGDRVIAMTGHGGLAEKVAAPARNSFHLPEDRSFVDGSALLMTYGTSIHALVDRGRLAAGQSLLVLGAAGGVGLAAVELGKAMGARVVGAVSSEEKAARVRAAGADDAIVYPRQPFDKDASKALAEQFKAAGGADGYHVIYDAVGGDYSAPALRSIAWEGRFLVVGFPAGIASLPLNLTLLKGCDVCGVFWGAFAMRDPAANRAHVERLFALWAEGSIAPPVSETFAFADGAQAIAALAERRAVGKLVVEVAA